MLPLPGACIFGERQSASRSPALADTSCSAALLTLCTLARAVPCPSGGLLSTPPLSKRAGGFVHPWDLNEPASPGSPASPSHNTEVNRPAAGPSSKVPSPARDQEFVLALGAPNAPSLFPPRVAHNKGKTYAPGAPGRPGPKPGCTVRNAGVCGKQKAWNAQLRFDGAIDPYPNPSSTRRRKGDEGGKFPTKFGRRRPGRQPADKPSTSNAPDQT